MLRRRGALTLLVLGVAALLCNSSLAEVRQVGVARVDITPNYPVRLAGYAVRTNESQGVMQHVWAKALAIGSDAEKPAILLTVDNCGVPLNVRDEVVRELKKARHIDPDRVAICSSHTHSAPFLNGYLRNLFLGPLPPDEQAHVERYTKETTEALIHVANEALDARQSCTLSRGKGEAPFAANRRPQSGPVDHDLPVLVVTGLDGRVVAVFASYACHCTTVTGTFNQICGDWSGYAQEALQRDYPGAIALIALGCAGDQNPNPRPGFELAKAHGEELAAGAEKVMKGTLTPVEGKLRCKTRELSLPLAPLPSREEWEARLTGTNLPMAKFARQNLSRLDEGQKLPKQVHYMVQTWTFDDSLAMVFLNGEVVVDYSLRLKKEFDSERLWINAYANDVPCYIPSERVLKEGGYEGGGAMIYYDYPAPFAPGIEDRIITTVHQLLPKGFLRNPAP